MPIETSFTGTSTDIEAERRGLMEQLAVGQHLAMETPRGDGELRTVRFVSYLKGEHFPRERFASDRWTIASGPAV